MWEYLFYFHIPWDEWSSRKICGLCTRQSERKHNLLSSRSRWWLTGIWLGIGYFDEWSSRRTRLDSINRDRSAVKLVAAGQWGQSVQHQACLPHLNYLNPQRKINLPFPAYLIFWLLHCILTKRMTAWLNECVIDWLLLLSLSLVSWEVLGVSDVLM